uniref:Uncharacterized protein n=1 Tax=Pinguiococcus pyrenoidosus TaxID=172671 RepID=A0A7R9UA50_9STRA
MGTELLRHLRECNGGATCGVCHPTDLPKSLLELQYLNHYTEELMFSTDERPSSAPSEKSDTSKLDLSEFLSGDDFESEDGDPEDDGLYVGAEEVEDLANFPELQDFLFETA